MTENILKIKKWSINIASLNINVDKLIVKLINLKKHKKYYQLILVVIANDTDDYYCDMMNKYWLPVIKYIKNNNLSIKVFLLFGQTLSNIVINNNDIIVANTGEGFVPQILQKTIFAFEYINENYDFKHLIRTNLSSFFITDKLLEESNKIPDNKIFTGSKVSHAGEFVTGCCFWLSKDVLDYLIKHKNNLNYNLNDDVAIGYVLYPLYYRDYINNYNQINTEDYSVLNYYDERILQKYNTYHIRIKSENRYNDAILMELLFKYYYKPNF